MRVATLTTFVDRPEVVVDGKPRLFLLPGAPPAFAGEWGFEGWGAILRPLVRRRRVPIEHCPVRVEFDMGYPQGPVAPGGPFNYAVQL